MASFITELGASDVQITVLEKWDRIRRTSGILYFEEGKPATFYRDYRNLEDGLATDIESIMLVEDSQDADT